MTQVMPPGFGLGYYQKVGVARVDVIDRTPSKGRLLSLIVPVPGAYAHHSAHDSDN